MKPETLHDRIYKRSFQSKKITGWRSNADIRHALEAATRFVADEKMSSFMAELANEAFIKARSALIPRIADSLRVQARPPHEGVWIEYDLHAYQRRAAEIIGRVLADPSEVPEREGWLIQAHPKLGDTACISHLFTSCEELREDGNDTWTFPFAFAWCCDDSPLPWRSIFGQTDSEHSPSACIVGISGYDRDNVSCVCSPLIEDPKVQFVPAYEKLLDEWTGVVRRTWALLATIDNLPLSYGPVRQSKGFLARGRVRPFLAHRTITLNIPDKKDSRTVARQAIATAHHKRHEVRAFWRNDWRHPPAKDCNPHLWETNGDADHIRCELCNGRQTYIHKHERGDARLGYVTHDYELKHTQGG